MTSTFLITHIICFFFAHVYTKETYLSYENLITDPLENGISFFYLSIYFAGFLSFDSNITECMEYYSLKKYLNRSKKHRVYKNNTV